MPGSGILRDILEASVAQVLVEDLALRVSGFGLQLLDFGIDVAVAHQNVGPAVVVEVEESAAPAEILGVQAQSGLKGGVLEVRATLVVIQGWSVAREIGFHDVEIAVEIVVGGRDAHAGLRLAVGTEGATGLERDVDELAVLLVLVKRAGGGVIGHVDVGPAIVVEVRREHAESVGSVRFENPGRFGDVGEGAVAVVVVEDVVVALQSGRSAGNHDGLVETRARFRHRRGLEIHVNVVGDEEVELAVAIVVDEGAAGAPAVFHFPRRPLFR